MNANVSLKRDGKVVALPPTPFAVLCALARRPGTLLTKEALLDEVWGHPFVSESVLKTVIKKLRTVLGDDARQPRFIETVSRRGYRFIAAVTPILPDAPARRDLPDKGPPRRTGLRRSRGGPGAPAPGLGRGLRWQAPGGVAGG